MARGLWVLAALLVVGLWVLSAALYPFLPDRIPGHYGLDGRVTRYDPPEMFWFVPVLVSFLVGLGFGLTRLAFRDYRLLNLPNKPGFLALPPSKQQRVLARLDAQLAFLFGLMVLAFGYLQWTSYRVATGQQAGLPVEVWIFPLAVLALIGWMVWDIGRTVRQETSSSQR